MDIMHRLKRLLLAIANAKPLNLPILNTQYVQTHAHYA